MDSSERVTYKAEYYTWQNMKRRCIAPKRKDFNRYGGRGITVCDRWLHDFSAFLADMGPRPGAAYSLERINNDGSYSPDNCRWATRSEQNRNHSGNHRLFYQGENLTIAEWSERTGLPFHVIRSRIVTYGWSAERALSTPKVSRSKPRHLTDLGCVTFQGETMTLPGWAIRLGIGYSTLHARIADLGWTVERALGTPARPYRT
jgi:hypothetical protein